MVELHRLGVETECVLQASGVGVDVGGHEEGHGHLQQRHRWQEEETGEERTST